MPLSNALRVSKNMSALFAGRLFDMVISFAFVIYIARLLGVVGFGQYALAQRYFELFLSLSATGLGIYITREIAKQRSALHQYLNAAILMVTGLTFASGIILVGLAQLFHYATETRAAIYLVVLALMPATIGAIFEAVFIAFEKAEYVSYGTIIESFLNTALSLLVLFLGYGLFALFVVLIFARVFLLVFYLVCFQRKIAKLSWSIDWVFLQRVFREWRVFALENWVSTIYGGLDIIILSSLQGEFAVGIYVAAAKLLRLGSIIAASYTTAIFPYMSRLFAESKDIFKQLSESSLKYMLAFIFPMAVTITVLANRIIVLLYTNKYNDSIPVLRVLAWLLVLDFFNPFFSHILFARGEQCKSLYVAVIKISCFSLVSLWLIPHWGGVGAAWAQVISAGVACGFYFAFVLRGKGMLQTLWRLGQTLPAAISLGLFFLLLKDVELIPLLAVGGVLYVFLLFLFRVLSTNDLKLLQGLK